MKDAHPDGLGPAKGRARQQQGGEAQEFEAAVYVIWVFYLHIDSREGGLEGTEYAATLNMVWSFLTLVRSPSA